MTIETYQEDTYTVRTMWEGELLAEHHLSADSDYWADFDETLSFTESHYPDTSGISVCLFVTSGGNVLASHTYA